MIKPGSIYDTEKIILNTSLLMLQLQRAINKTNVFDSDIIASINTLIDGFVVIASNINNIECSNKRLTNQIETLGEIFERLIVAYENERGFEKVSFLYNEELVPQFICLRNDFNIFIEETTGLKSVIICGVNYLATNLHHLLNNKTRIIAYISDERQYEGKFIEDIPVLQSRDIIDFFVSFALETDDLTYPHNALYSFDLYSFIKKSYDFELYRANKFFNLFKGNKGSYSGFVTGLSYAEVGVDTNELQPYNVVNLAVSSQDLYYDYHWIKSIVKYQGVNFVFIGLSYYSLEYDLSKSKFRSRTEMYTPIFNWNEVELSFKTTNNNNGILEILKSEFLENIYDILKVYGESWWDNYTNRQLSDSDSINGRQIAETDCRKNYPETVLKNTRILKDMVSLLVEHDIKPIFLICPTSRHYNQYFCSRIKNEFLRNINIVAEEFNVDVIDLFDSVIFKEEDFYDVSHLNKTGSKKLSSILKSYLNDVYY